MHYKCINPEMFPAYLSFIYILGKDGTERVGKKEVHIFGSQIFLDEMDKLDLDRRSNIHLFSNAQFG